MTAGRAWRPVALAVLLALAPATAAVLAPATLLDQGSSAFRIGALVALGAAAAYLIWILPPALTLTAGIVLSPLAGNWRLLGFPGGLSPDRYLLVAGVAVVLLRAPGAVGLPRLSLTATHALLGVVLLYAIVSAALAGTLFEKDPFFHLFDSFGILPFLVFLVASAAFHTARSRSLLLAGFVGLGVYLGLTALFEALQLNALVFPRFVRAATAGTDRRAFGVFLEPVSNGTGLFVCGVAAVIAFATWRRAATRALAALTAILCATGAFFTLERSVWIGASAAGVVGAAISIRRARRRAAVLVAGAALIAVAALIVGAALLFVPGLSTSVHRRATNQMTIWDRQSLATAAENMIRARPLFGFGWNTFERKSLDYFQQSPDFPLDPSLAFRRAANGTFLVHNRFLEYGATLGLVGAALWILGLLLAIGGAFRARGSPDFERWRLGLLPVLVFYLVISNAVPPALFPDMALWLWLGVVWSGYARDPVSVEPADLGVAARAPRAAESS